MSDRQTEPVLSQARQALTTNRVSTAIKVLATFNASHPDVPQVLELLADAFVADNQIINALKALDRVIEIESATAITWHKTGNLLAQIREYAQAIGAYQESLKLDGENAEARHDYGRVLYKLGDVGLAAEQLEISARLCEDIAPWQSLATLAPANPAYNHADVLRIRKTYAQKLSDLETNLPNAEPPDEYSLQIKVGYFSSWFDRENYMKPVWALVNRHDRSEFDVHLFTDTSAKEGIGGYEANPSDTIHETAGLSNHQLAEVIRAAKIDILIDLNAYSTVERLGLFLTRPAPVTAAWFNMYATSGFPGFDYIIGDEITVRKEEEQHYSEKVLRLSQSYLSFIVTHGAPELVPPPCLDNGYVTFGSLVSQYKLTNPVLDAWSEILLAVADSKLLLGNADLDSQCNRDYVTEKFDSRGVSKDRLEFCGRAAHFEFLKYYDLIDIALDAFPYNGGTTTMEAIWQGVPVVTFVGDRWASRTSASILAGTKAEEFVAGNRSGYISTAVELASGNGHSERLREIRLNMRASLLQSPACDTGSLAAAMEKLYREIGKKNVNGLEKGQ